MADRALVLDDFIPYRLSITSNLVSDTIAGTYEALFGLRIPEWRLVTVLAEMSDLTQQDIGVRTRMDKMTVSRAAAALVERGLVERHVHPGDKRSRLLALSEQGRALYAAVAPKALELERRIFDHFEPDEVDAFVAMLHRIDAITLALRAEQGHPDPGGAAPPA